MKKVIFFLLLFSLFFTACKNKKNADKPVALAEASVLSVKEDTIDNGYTKIALSFCDTTASTYPESLTSSMIDTCFDLNNNVPFDCFMLAASFCGRSGSCGYDISIYKKTKTGYHIPFSSCGSDVRGSIESNFGYSTFTYKNRLGFKYKVFYDGKNFVEKPLTINGLDYIKMKKIADKTGTSVENFEPESIHTIATNKVSIQDFEIGKNINATLYSVLFSSGLVRHFLFDKDSLLFNIKDINSLEAIKNEQKAHYNLKSYSNTHYQMTIDTAYYVPSIYVYSEKKGRYMKK